MGTIRLVAVRKRYVLVRTDGKTGMRPGNDWAYVRRPIPDVPAGWATENQAAAEKVADRAGIEIEEHDPREAS